MPVDSVFTARYHLSLYTEADTCVSRVYRLYTEADLCQYHGRHKICLLWLWCPLNLKWKHYRFLLAALLTLWETFWAPGQSPERFLSVCLRGDTFWAPCPCSNLLLMRVESDVYLGQSWLITLLPWSKFTWLLHTLPTVYTTRLHVRCLVKAMRDGGKSIWNLRLRINTEQFLVQVVRP